MYRKILVPTDGSDISRRAAATALELARVMEASVVALYVVDIGTFPTTFSVAPESGPYFAALAEDLRKFGADVLRAIADEASGKGIALRQEIVEGIPSAAILEAARKDQADVIVMGTHGRTGLKALILGSTAQAVVHGSQLPILLVR